MLETEQRYSRFKDAPWFTKEGEDPPYGIIGGAGGIGSWLALLLVRAGFDISVIDFDKIEDHNIGGQLYTKDQVGQYKVAALHNTINNLCDHTIDTLSIKIDKDTNIGDYFMFSAFDNMQARKDYFNIWKNVIKEHPKDVSPIFIDGRLTMEQLQIFCVTEATMGKYEKEYLFDDEEAEDEICSLKQTSHSAAMIASHMVAFFTNHITNIHEKKYVREVPFMYEYFIPISYLNEIR